MCGVAGIYAYHCASLEVDRRELRRVRDHMTARGPDGVGEWYSSDGRIGLGNRRLSIIDLSDRAAQPMVSTDGKYVITFNGEIYNYKVLRKDLEAKGRIFRTQSDTEVLIHLYAAKGEAMVHDLRGMFAFAIWDGDKRKLLLARDPYGIKPLYYADDGKTFRFASQVKALQASRTISRDLDPAGCAGFCLFGSVPEPYTTYLAIRAVPAGAVMWVGDRGPQQPEHYFSISGTFFQAEKSPLRLNGNAMRYHVRQALLDSVRHHLVADVPVGVFLSAGVDSSALVGLMRDAGQKDVQTVTLAFEEFRGQHDDETPLAEKIAAGYGTRHRTRLVTEEEFRADLPKILDSMDQPTIDGINTWFVSKAAREAGLKVALSGIGGDELFGGYPSFRDIPRWVRVMKAPSGLPIWGGFLRRILSQFIQGTGRLSPKAAGMAEYGGSFEGAYLLRRGLYMPWELDQILGRRMARAGLGQLNPLQHIAETLNPRPRGAFAKVAVMEASLYMRNQLLRDADWAGMAHSLEIRVPFVDVGLLRALVPIAIHRPPDKNAIGMAPAQPVPQEVMSRRKTGFSTPVARWLTRLQVGNTQGRGLRPWAQHVLSAQKELALPIDEVAA